MYNAVRRVQEELTRSYERRIRRSMKAGPGELDLNDDEGNIDRIATEYMTVTPIISRTFRNAGQTGIKKARVGIAFDQNAPEAEAWLAKRTQRFVRQVSETAWANLKGKLTQAMNQGTSVDNLVQIVRDLPDFAPGRAEMIARTEVIGAYNGGLEEGFRQSGNVVAKVWLATLDDRTRETHLELHETEVPIGSDFVSSSGAKGPAPGQMGEAGEDINCRCSLEAIVGVAEPDIVEIPAGGEVLA